MVNFALGKGRGIKKGDVVYVVAYEHAKPFYIGVLRAITKAGGHALSRYMPDNDARFNADRDFFVGARDHQIHFFPSKFYRGLVDTIDHSIWIEGEADMQSLVGVDPKKMMLKQSVMKPYREWRREKENHNAFSWTIALYGTPAMAHEAGLSERAYWEQIIRACFLDSADPVARWRRVEKRSALRETI